MSFLIIYFIGNKKAKGPDSMLEWEGALNLLKSYLGLRRHKLSKFMIDVFIDSKNVIPDRIE